jgi:hypothetical protein
VLLNGAAEAHSWYPKDCCHDHDCQPVPCAELVTTRHGLMWRGLVVFSEPQIKASPDQALLRFEDFLTLVRTKLELVCSPVITAVSDANNLDLVIRAKFTAQRSLR